YDASEMSDQVKFNYVQYFKVVWRKRPSISPDEGDLTLEPLNRIEIRAHCIGEGLFRIRGFREAHDGVVNLLSNRFDNEEKYVFLFCDVEIQRSNVPARGRCNVTD